MLRRYYYTIRDLRWIQIKFQILRRLFKSPYKELSFQKSPTYLAFNIPQEGRKIISKDREFTFLNLTCKFSDQIDWSFLGHGRLWQYNLNYFDFLNQEDLEPSLGLDLIHSWIKDPQIEPYPSSLRLINWIRYVSKHRIEDRKIIDSIFSQGKYLLSNIEYHLLGNHLLENGFALLITGSFLNNKGIFSSGLRIVSEQLDEQILADGAHFELSPMYHKIILYRVLECLDLVQSNQIEGVLGLEEKLSRVASSMLSWLSQMTFKNGSQARVNDSVGGIAPSEKVIIQSASVLGIEVKKSIPLGTSGYRIIRNSRMEVLFDVGDIGPHYIPGHAHSDTLNIVAHLDKQPLLVDTGISTYEKNQLRQEERSTKAHNTVVVDGQEQSEIWGGFRVARKARILSLSESENEVSASHDGYKGSRCIHERKVKLEDKELIIEDHLSSDVQAKCYLHFHPDQKLSLQGSVIYFQEAYINFENCLDIDVQDYSYALGFNKTQKASMVVITFRHNLVTRIHY